jgi:transposase-like protein
MRRYWRAADAEEVMAAWRRSGESVAAFARQQGVSAVRLLRWRARLKAEAPPTFQPVRVVADRGPNRPGASEPLMLEVRGGRRIRVPEDFDAQHLERLVRTVEGWEC